MKMDPNGRTPPKRMIMAGSINLDRKWWCNKVADFMTVTISFQVLVWELCLPCRVHRHSLISSVPELHQPGSAVTQQINKYKPQQPERQNADDSVKTG